MNSFNFWNTKIFKLIAFSNASYLTLFEKKTGNKIQMTLRNLLKFRFRRFQTKFELLENIVMPKETVLLTI